MRARLEPRERTRSFASPPRGSRSSGRYLVFGRTLSSEGPWVSIARRTVDAYNARYSMCFLNESSALYVADHIQSRSCSRVNETSLSGRSMSQLLFDAKILYIYFYLLLLSVRNIQDFLYFRRYSDFSKILSCLKALAISTYQTATIVEILVLPPNTFFYHLA